MLSDICYEKSEHIRTNWQDRALARVWQNVGRSIDALAAGIRRKYNL